ncbi:hypothetical protein [Actinomadura terrae]|uniref:hypothetical protein n=1 Tax=Actinomadura terrae TaxID=604353 RepID=UPI001FA6C001|nr:hypothetical protein [Actinomadura terrae]
MRRYIMAGGLLVGSLAALTLPAIPGSASTRAQTTATEKVGAAKSLRSSIVSIARSELGQQERPPGSNCTKYGPCEVWCGYFTMWVNKMAGAPYISSGHVPTIRSWALSVGNAHLPQNAKKGDLIFWDPDIIQWHNGIVVSVSADKKKIRVISGNVGEAVVEKTYKRQTFDVAISVVP